LIAALERCEVRLSSAAEAGRVAVLDLMRARTRRFEVVFVLGLEEGSLPRRGRSSPFLDDDRRRALGARLERPDQVSRDRYLFYTACTRPARRLYVVRQAAGDDGSPLEESPFWQDVVAVFVHCSAASLPARLTDPKTIAAAADALPRGKLAHQALHAFYSGPQKELGVERVTPESLEPALGFLVRCLDDALGSGVRIELAEV